MHGIYNYIPETTHISRVYSVAAVLYLQSVLHGVLVGKPEGKGPLGRPRHRLEANIKMDLQDVGRSPWTELYVV
jgi:hypothetical protein